MNTEFSKNELDEFLDEVCTDSSISQSSTKDDALEKLLDEVMDTTSPHLLDQSSLETAPVFSLREEESEKRPRKFSVPLWLSISILVSFFLGTMFGFYWGKTERIAPSHPASAQNMYESLSSLEEKMKALQEALLPKDPQNEIITPLEDASSMDLKLHPKAMM